MQVFIVMADSGEDGGTYTTMTDMCFTTLEAAQKAAEEFGKSERFEMCFHGEPFIDIINVKE